MTFLTICWKFSLYDVDIQKNEDWKRVSVEDIYKLGGEEILKQYDGSLAKGKKIIQLTDSIIGDHNNILVISFVNTH